MTTKQLLEDLTEIRRTLDDLEKLLPAAYECQWERSPAPRSREDTTERAKGGPPSDPTSATVLDDRRLDLRANVRRAEAVVAYVKKSTDIASRGLALSLETWEGSREEKEND
jgi:hypothetical protein